MSIYFKELFRWFMHKKNPLSIVKIYWKDLLSFIPSPAVPLLLSTRSRRTGLHNRLFQVCLLYTSFCIGKTNKEDHDTTDCKGKCCSDNTTGIDPCSGRYNPAPADHCAKSDYKNVPCTEYFIKFWFFLSHSLIPPRFQIFFWSVLPGILQLSLIHILAVRTLMPPDCVGFT